MSDQAQKVFDMWIGSGGNLDGAAMHNLERGFIAGYDNGQKRIADLVAALAEAREHFNSLPQSAFNSVEDTPDCQGYWIRDAIIDKISRALAEGKTHE